MPAALLLGATLAAAWPAGPIGAAEGVPPVPSRESGPRLADRLFRVEWTAEAGSQGQTRIIGHVYNESDHDAVNVELRISELDASGRTVESVIKQTSDPVPAAGRAFFDLQVPNTSPFYRARFGESRCPQAVRATEEVLSLPVHPALADADLDRIVDAVRRFAPGG